MEGALVEKSNHAVWLSAHELAAHLAGIIDISDDAISSSNLEGRVLSWNRGATRLYGWPAADALASAPNLIPAELRDFEDRILQQVLGTGTVEHYDSKRQRRDGSLVDVAITLAATRNSTGHISGIAQIARNLSERREAGPANVLSTGAAHDFNNLLTIIVTYSALVLEALEADSPLRSDLEEISQAGRRAAELTRELWASGTPSDPVRASETILISEPGERASPGGNTKNCA
jgi:PAS domain S-box-containing protein